MRRLLPILVLLCLPLSGCASSKVTWFPKMDWNPVDWMFNNIEENTQPKSELYRNKEFFGTTYPQQ
jgi:hypothetical protein